MELKVNMKSATKFGNLFTEGNIGGEWKRVVRGDACRVDKELEEDYSHARVGESRRRGRRRRRRGVSNRWGGDLLAVAPVASLYGPPCSCCSSRWPVSFLQPMRWHQLCQQRAPPPSGPRRERRLLIGPPAAAAHAHWSGGGEFLW